MKLPKILKRKKKPRTKLKFFGGAILLLLMGYLVVDIFGGKILTAVYHDHFKPLRVTLADIDLSLTKGQIELNRIEVYRESGSRIALVKHFNFAPRFKEGTLFFNSIRLKDALLDVSVADVPENLEKKSEPLKIKPRFDKIEMSHVDLTIRDVKGIEGDRFLTFRDIHGKVDCQGHRLCLGNTFTLQALPMKNSKIEISGMSDFRKEKKLDVRGEIQSVRLSVLNTFLTESSPVVAESGRADLFTEYNLRGSEGDGYVKFFVENLRFKEKKGSTAGFLASTVGKVIADREIEHFDIRIPVKVSQNKFKLEQVDVKKEIQRILAGRMLPKGFDSKKQAQEL